MAFSLGLTDDIKYVFNIQKKWSLGMKRSNFLNEEQFEFENCFGFGLTINFNNFTSLLIF